MNTEPTSNDSLGRKVARIAFKVWLALHLVLVTLWCLPRAPQGAEQGLVKTNVFEKLFLWNDRTLRNSPLRHYLIATGFWQYWDMFAPNPLSVDYYGDTAVEMSDGTLRQQTYPRINTLGIADKYSHERYRKYFERVSDPANQHLWPAFCQRIALENTDSKDVYPVRVTLVVYSRRVGPPGKDPKPWTYDARTLYAYVVDRDLMFRQKGWQP